MRPSWLAWLLLLPTGIGDAQRVVTSAGPDDVSVTIYRAPDRRPGREIDADDPAGFALVTERRTVTLPAGPAVIRFEGVAGNILPESAIVADLPRDVIEKNLDADLFSPRSLYDRMLGRRVLIRRTDKATGKTIEQQAIVRSSADGAALLQLTQGIEAFQCTGLAEALIYPEVPAGLSAKPTLSIRTDSPRPVKATLTLSYLAGGFDWQADYVVTMRPDGRGADLFAWITLASSDVTSFVGAQASVVAGKLNRVARDEEREFGSDNHDGALRLRCFPTGPNYALPPMVSPPAIAVPPAIVGSAEIIVTAARVAKQEELGDLKLYRFPDRVTVASQAQKQVAFLTRDAVPVRAVYMSDVYGDSANDPYLVLRAVNRSAEGLGIPLPAGQVQVFQQESDRPMLIGSASIDDKAVGENIEYRLEAGPSVSVDIANRPATRRSQGHFLTVTNANPWPIAFEAKLGESEDQKLHFKQRLIQRDGRYIWATTVPANGTAVFDYELEDVE